MSGSLLPFPWFDLVLILALGSFAGWNFWKTHQANKSIEASALYDELQTSLLANDNAKVQRIAGDIRVKLALVVVVMVVMQTTARGPLPTTYARQQV